MSTQGPSVRSAQCTVHRAKRIVRSAQCEGHSAKSAVRSARCARAALALMCALTASSGAAQTFPAPKAEPTPGPRSLALEPLVEVAPIRCWWRTSAGAVVLGEPFDVRLTCAVLENESVQVVPDETRLTVASVPLKPFEVLGGAHPADTHAGQRRFLQYLYTLRLIEPETVGQDVSLPRLPITYRVQSRVAADAALAGRDLTYFMPDVSVRVLAQVPADAGDIRDGADVGLEHLEALQFRARLFDIGAVVSLAAAALLGVFAVVAAVTGTRAPRSRERARLPDRRLLAAAGAELSRIARETEGGWTPPLISAGHAALRVVAAVALGRSVSEQPLATGEAPADGRLAVRPLMPRRPGAAITSTTTPADVAQAMAAGSASNGQRERYAALRDALVVFTAAQFASNHAAPESAALSSAIDTGRAEVERLVRERRWPRWRWLRPAATGSGVT